MKTLILDNYDSFTYNLYQYIGELHGNPVVHRNDQVTMEQVKEMNPSHIIISPGPGNPDTERDVGISYELIAYAVENQIPLLGVCLGHQVLGGYFGAKVERAPYLMHGKSSVITLDENPGRLLAGQPDQIEVMRYHSLYVKDELPADVHVTARTDDGMIMAMEHSEHALFGIQFHPESIGTPVGMDVLVSFLQQS